MESSVDGKLDDVKCLVNSTDELEQTPLHVAIENAHTSVAEYLISLPQSNLEARDNRAQTPLHIACSYSSTIDIVKLLVQKSVDLNLVNDDGDTGLHKAAVVKNTSVVEYLISLPGCDIHIKNKLGKTALDIAKDENYSEITHLLEKRGCEKKIYNPVTAMSREQQNTSTQHFKAFTKCLQVELDQYRHNESEDIKLKVDNIRKELAAVIVKIDELKITKEVEGAAAAVGSSEMPDLVLEASSLYSRIKSVRVREPGNAHYHSHQ